MKGWEMVNGADHAAWITQQLNTLIDYLRLRLVDGDPVVLDLMEDLEDDVMAQAPSMKNSAGERLERSPRAVISGPVSRR